MQMTIEKSVLPRVTENSELEISFKLFLLDGTLVEQTEEDDVFRFQIGDGQFLHNLEELLIGLEEGTTGKFTLVPEQAFGLPDPQNLQSMKKTDFPNDMVFEEGYVIGFNTPTGGEVPGTVHQVKEDEIVIDFNHPLAGKTLTFEATIKRVLS